MKFHMMALCVLMPFTLLFHSASAEIDLQQVCSSETEFPALTEFSKQMHLLKHQSEFKLLCMDFRDKLINSPDENEQNALTRIRLICNDRMFVRRYIVPAIVYLQTRTDLCPPHLSSHYVTKAGLVNKEGKLNTSKPARECMSRISKAMENYRKAEKSNFENAYKELKRNSPGYKLNKKYDQPLPAVLSAWKTYAKEEKYVCAHNNALKRIDRFFSSPKGVVTAFVGVLMVGISVMLTMALITALTGGAAASGFGIIAGPFVLPVVFQVLIGIGTGLLFIGGAGTIGLGIKRFGRRNEYYYDSVPKAYERSERRREGLDL